MKIEVFKSGDGKLFENENDYILHEAKYQRNVVLERWGKLNEIVTTNPEQYYGILKMIGEGVIKNGDDLKTINLNYNKAIDIFKKEKVVKRKQYQNTDLDNPQIEYEPYLWGNDCLSGFDVNR